MSRRGHRLTVAPAAGQDPVGAPELRRDQDQRCEAPADPRIGYRWRRAENAETVERAQGRYRLNIGVARDTRESFRDHLAAARESDLLVTTAGISVGEHDFVRPVLEEMGATQKFWKLRMRPGAPVGFGLLGDVPWIGLPGNPVSVFVSFEVFIRPALLKMMGRRDLFRPEVDAELTELAELSVGDMMRGRA